MRFRRKFRTTIVLLFIACVTWILYVSWERDADCSGFLCDVKNTVHDSANRLFSFLRKHPVLKGPIGDFERYPCFKAIGGTVDVIGTGRGTCVRTFNEIEVEGKIECVPLKTAVGFIPLCVQNTSVHRLHFQDGYEESEVVKQVSDAFLMNPDLQFLDIGTGLGIYTLAVAKIGRRAIAFDSVLQNLRLLSNALKIADLQNKVKLYWNAVLNENGIVSLTDAHGLPPAYVLETYNGKEKKRKTSGYFVESVKLDSIAAMFKHTSLFMRINMGKHTLNISNGAGNFFEDVDVRYILVNFAGFKRSQSGQDVIDTLTDNSFDPYADVRRSHALDKQDLTKWPDNVFWIKTY